MGTMQLTAGSATATVLSYTSTTTSTSTSASTSTTSIYLFFHRSRLSTAPPRMQKKKNRARVMLQMSSSLFSPHGSKQPPPSMMMKKPSPDDSGVLANSNTSYVAPLESPASGSSFIIRPLAEILRDLNKRIPDQVLVARPGADKYIPWYQANRMLSFYAPGWCGEVRGITYSVDGNYVTVIYRVTIRGSDGEAFREASGTVSLKRGILSDPSQEAEGLAFVRACARFGLGLYLHHEEQ